MINPLDARARRPRSCRTYKVEPYVVAADVYTAAGQLGRGGWTWYTGSASWMYRVALEAILGFTRARRHADRSRRACRRRGPSSRSSTASGTSTYTIVVRNPGDGINGDAEVSVDGVTLDTPHVQLVDDGRPHEVVVRGPASSARVPEECTSGRALTNRSMPTPIPGVGMGHRFCGASHLRSEFRRSSCLIAPPCGASHLRSEFRRCSYLIALPF